MLQPPQIRRSPRRSLVPVMVKPMIDAGQRRRGDMYTGIPLGGLGDVDTDFGPLMTFTASERARSITSQIIARNGGLGVVRGCNRSQESLPRWVDSRPAPRPMCRSNIRVFRVYLEEDR
jgi:hypothetical protein